MELSEQLSKLLYCSNCKQAFNNDAHWMPTCMHALCSKCLNKALESKPVEEKDEPDEFATILTCPICKNAYKLEDELQEELPTNEILNFVSKLYSQTAKEKESICEECGVNMAKKYCRNCQKSFCPECTEKIHSFKSFQKHEVAELSLTTPTHNDSIFACNEHPTKQKEYYCTECETSVSRVSRKDPICDLALLLKKNSLVIDSLEKKSNEIDALLDIANGVVPTAKLKIQENLEKAAELLEKRKIQLLSDLEIISHSIDSHLRKFMTTFDRRSKELELCEHVSKSILDSQTSSALVYELESALQKLQNTEELVSENISAEDFSVNVDFDGIEKFFDSLGYIDSPSFNLIGGPGVMEITGAKELSGEIKCTKLIIKANAVLTVKPWDGTSGGVLKIFAKSRIIIEKGGKIDLTGKGYRGGEAVPQCYDGKAKQGESFNGKGGDLQEANKGGGGAGLGTSSFGGYGGGGGGYGAKGDDAEPNRYSGQVHPGAKGGETYGDEKITELYMGSGGGSGHPYSNGQTKGKGGNGGGALLLQARLVLNEGEIICDGEKGEDSVPNTYGSGGGGGSGGSILFITKLLINNGSISAKGGEKGIANYSSSPGINSSGGKGGDGRIAIKGLRTKGAPSVPNWFLYKK
ncbi:bonus isoform c-related [Anaeramoeba ignava]|uniref:Bonus isoform c-related n=1 Tax=Anaeramoeba ignava TaxID=1746090 RepID=A0A9Q0LV06_ANAIG|nr:bonus isoform c-related [Anaeramoeba ignava]